jgi:hypothetical protein
MQFANDLISGRNQGQERHRQCCHKSFVKIDNRFDI